MSGPESPDPGELLRGLADFIKGTMFCQLPGKVVAYNPATQTASVKPTISARREDEETGAIVPEILPILPDVPVLFPSGGGVTITWPLLPDDPVVLFFMDRSTEEYRATGLPENFPMDPRRFDLSDAVAVPGFRPDIAPIPPSGVGVGLVIESTVIQLGSSAAVSPVVLEAILTPFLQAVELWMATHVHAGGTLPSGSTGAPASTPPSVPGGLGSIKVKVE